MAGFGRSLELYFIEGKPDGMLTAEVFNWTGHILKAPRTQIKQALARPQAKHTGVYVLFGERDGQSLAYVGESEDVSERIRGHDSQKDWWTDAIIVTTAADSLHKAHVKYLESRLVEQARSAGTTPLDNGNTPPRASLSEAGQANMEEFLDTLFMVLPALGIDMFTSRKRPDPVADPTSVAENVVHFFLETPKHGIRARALLQGSDFVVQKGSTARNIWAGKGEHDFGYRELHRKLVSAGIIVPGPERAEFAENYAFNSPSAAAAVVNGRPANGRLEWKVEGDGRPYKVWEADQLKDVDG